MREVAAEAGVSLPVVQYYFTTKDNLLLRALPYLGEQLWGRVQQMLHPLGGTGADPRQVLEATLYAILPTDEQSRRITLAYNAYQTLAITAPNAATRHALTYPNAMETSWPTRSAGPSSGGTSRPGTTHGSPPRSSRAHQRPGRQRPGRPARR